MTTEDMARQQAFPRAGSKYDKPSLGMTLRQYYAGRAMQGVLADPNCKLSGLEIVETAVSFADLLIAELCVRR